MPSLPVLIYIVIVSILLHGGAHAAEQSVDDIKKAIISNRLALKRWKMILRYRVPVDTRNMDSSLNDTLELSSWVDGPFARTDVLSRYSPELTFPGLEEESHWTYTITTPVKRIWWSTRKHPDLPSGIRIDEIKENEDQAGDRLLPAGALDIRWMGWHCQYGLGDFRMPDLFYDPQFTDWRFHEEKLGEIDCLKLTYRRVTGSDIGRMWVAPSFGYSVVRDEFEVRDRYPDAELPPHLSTAMFEQRQWRDSGIWFPESAVREVLVDGEVIRREEIVFQILSLNEALDPDDFAVKALNPPVGTPVLFSPLRHEAFRWDGSSIVQASSRSRPTAETQEQMSALSTRWLLLLNAFILTVLCTVCLWRAFRKRSAS